VSTFYRVLREAGENRERRAQATHPATVKPELAAAGPNQVYSWDITKLVSIKVVEGVFTEKQRHDLAARITDVMVAFEGSEAEVVWVLIEETPPRQLGTSAVSHSSGHPP
jgi:phenylpyruvate tautomerase PptA (4-oxalocrotonate tautomerase family)